MTRVSATEFSRNLSKFLDAAEFRGEGVTIVRNRQAIARLVSGPARMNAMEAMGDLFGTLAGKSSENDLEATRLDERLEQLRDPWREVNDDSEG